MYKLDKKKLCKEIKSVSYCYQKVVKAKAIAIIKKIKFDSAPKII